MDTHNDSCRFHEVVARERINVLPTIFRKLFAQ